jgi:antitoxin MazE
MKIKIIPIGNSQGIRIPKAIIEQCGFNNSVEMEVIDGSLVLTPIKNVREGWSESFQEMAANGDDELLIDDAIPTVEDEDWEW